MKTKRSLTILLVLALVALLAGCGSSSPSSAAADDNTLPEGYPKDNIEIIVPYAPGGGSDTLARALIANIDLPVSMVAINIEGANGMVGTMQAYNSDPDGYTIVVQSAQDLMGFSMSGATDIRLFEEMETICNLVGDYTLVACNKQSGWTTIEELVEYAKAHPGEIKWSCSGAQGIEYAETQLVLEGLGIKELVTVVPYDGGAAGNTALMGNHVQVSTNAVIELSGAIASGDVIPLLALSDTRLDFVPDVPTSLEKGVNYSSYSPRGFYAPPGTPKAIVKYLQDAVEKVAQSPEFAEQMMTFGLVTRFMPGDEALAHMQSEEEFLRPFFEEMEEE